MDGLQDCKLWITGKAIPSGEKLLKHVPKEGIVLNFSVPNPLGEKALKRRPDVYVVEGGLLEYDPTKTSLSFAMRLKPGITYACHAGTMVHANEGWKHHEVGPVDISDLGKTWAAGKKIGFLLPDLPPLPITSEEAFATRINPRLAIANQ